MNIESELLSQRNKITMSKLQFPAKQEPSWDYKKAKAVSQQQSSKMGKLDDAPMRFEVEEGVVVVVVNLASIPPQFLGYASSDPEGLGSQIGANYVRD